MWVRVRNQEGFLTFNSNVMSSPSTKLIKAQKTFPVSYANPRCVGSPGVFITPGTYLIYYKIRLDSSNGGFHMRLRYSGPQLGMKKVDTLIFGPHNVQDLNS